MKNAILISWVFSLMFVGTVSATIINVPGDQPNIQAGIDASSNGDTVRVASGTYVENIDFSGKNIVLGSWFLDVGDTSFISSTIIDGNAVDRVVNFTSGETNDAKITGFTIQNGLAEDGGGIYCSYSDPTISNNTISGNSAGYDGGGIYCLFSDPTISDNTISGNSAVNYGGGIHCYNSSPTISHNTISENSAGAVGGIYCYDSSPTISHNTISENSAGAVGGIACYNNSSPTISNNIISGNSADDHGFGGGIYCYESSPTISNNTISGNSASYYGWGGGIYCNSSNPTITYNLISGNSAEDQGYGGGICCSNNSSPTISNNTISGNSSGWSGGGIFCDNNSNPTISNNNITGNSAITGGGIRCGQFSPTISNNTISGNTADYGGGIFCYNSSPPITNTIFWADSAPTGPEIFLEGTSSPIITYCDIQGGWAGDGNIDCDPMFCYPDTGNYYLAENSCCVGSGEGGADIGALGIGCGMRYKYLPGDVNMALGLWPPAVIGGDVTYLVGYFIGGGQESCLLDGFWCSADINGDCLIIGGDVTALVGYFVAGGSLVPCPDYQSVWPPLPEEAPAGWPNCDPPVINSRVIPTGSVK